MISPRGGTRNHKSLARLIARPESSGRRASLSDASASVKERNEPDGRESRPFGPSYGPGIYDSGYTSPSVGHIGDV